MPQKGAPSLYDAAKRQALRMLKNIDDLGDMPFKVAEPLLKKVQTAAHLRRIEVNCPQYVGETRQIWINMIKRDVLQWNELEPKNPASWCKLYAKLVAAETKATAASALILKNAFSDLAAEKGDRQIMTTNLLHKSQIKGSRAAKRAPSVDQSSLRFNNGSRTKMVTGKDVVARAKREARERSQALNSNSILAQPTHKLNQRATIIRTAPTGLVQQHQTTKSTPTQTVKSTSVQTIKSTSIQPTKSASVQATKSAPVQDIKKSIETDDTPRKVTQKEREARLKAAKEDKKKPSSVPSQSTASSSSVSLHRATDKPASKSLPFETYSKRKADELEDLFRDRSGSEAKDSSSTPPVKRRRIITPPLPPPCHTKRPPPSIFIKPTRKPVSRR